ncbi:hypothetical protein V0288_01360 [Pannus brasiliensis CCIBt3594]|uniref:FHA domain containing protein n=1 Tax=Pannus brasiliensis CCIBt3594 TaxID=1427578 RepID=A0AAW9QKS9_9CHRO
MKTLGVYLSIGILAFLVTACSDRLTATDRPSPDSPNLPVVHGKLSEVAPPPAIRELHKSLDRYAPQVAILSPAPDQLFEGTTVNVELQVTDLPVFQDPELDLGPYLSLVLDNEPAREIHDLSGPVTLGDLSPGTHTLRVFAARPWHESFKNDGAYARTTFHVKTKTGSNAPDPKLPVLTYNRPRGVYGAEPILLDFYLANAPLHVVARESEADEIRDWRVRVTVNGESFLLDTWEPIYLQGFDKGDNLVKLEFIDEKGNVIENVFNTTARLITYDPAYEDSLTKLVKGEIPVPIARKIVDPNYTATPVIGEEPAIEEEPAPVTETEAIPEPIEEPTATEEIPPAVEEPVAEETPEPIELPALKIPEEVGKAETPIESPPLPLPELVLPEDLETPTAEPVQLPRLVLPDEGQVTAAEPVAPPEIVLPAETEATETPTIEPPPAEPNPPRANPWIDRFRGTLDRWRSARGEGSEPVKPIAPERSPAP